MSFEVTDRELRKLEKLTLDRKVNLYDEKGSMSSSGLDLCDCLDSDCPGCFFPCPKCRNTKCGHECRNNRKFAYSYAVVEGTDQKIVRNTAALTMVIKDLQRWAHDRILSLFSMDLPEDVITYLLTIDNPADAQEFMQSVYTGKDPESKIRQFVTELGSQRNPQKREGRNPAPGVGPGDGKQPKKYLDSSLSNEYNFVRPDDSPSSSSQAESSSGQQKKRVKQLNLFSQDGQARDVVMLKGRHRCECQASKHELVSNCLKCGRIVCTQEGAGPCLFCGNLVMSREDEEIIARGSKKSEKLMQKLMDSHLADDEPAAGLSKAVEHKNKLLEYDRTCEQRTQVIDDKSDYYSSGNRWLSEDERRIIREKEKEMDELRHGPRKAVKISIDLFGRQIVEDQPENLKIDFEAEFKKPPASKKWEEKFEDNYNPTVDFPKPIFEDSGILKPTANAKQSRFPAISRLQDSDLQIMSDDGLCLSMHQPYASLLVAGIKRHEGRTWYSTHRGRLWIASAVKVPTQQEISELENMYRHILNDDNLPFPEAYPAGCLLGCVDVTDVLPQEEYRNRYPTGESEAPYVFICENPQELLVKFPAKGQHKIYKLPPQLHQSAKKSLACRK